MSEKKRLFEIIATEIKQKIERGEYKTGILMPSEKELEDSYAVSRTTIRRAIDMLVSDKLVIRKNGVGLYVQPKLTSQNILEMTGVMKNRSAQVLQKELKDFYIRKAGKYYAAQFNIKENELIYLIKFIQKTNSTNTVEILLLPLYIYPDLQAKDFQIISVLELINSGKYPLYELEQELQLITASHEQMKQLQTEEDTPIFKLSTTYFAETKIPLAIGYRYENAMLTEYVVDFN